MNQERGYFGITYDSVRKEVYVLGGNNRKQYLNQCEKYSIEKDEWTEIAPLGGKKEGVSACILNNKFIYAIGGKDIDDFTNDIEKYTIGGNV